MSSRDIVSENSIKGIDSSSSIKSNEILNVNDIIYTGNLASPRNNISNIDISKNNKFKKYIIYIIYIIIMILFAAIGVFSLISYFIDENIKNCVNENIFNIKSTFINAII